jgi:hypothetical protein
VGKEKRGEDKGRGLEKEEDKEEKESFKVY